MGFSRKSNLKAGLAKTDITPRIGVELAGFGPFICRHSIGIRDRLWARALALCLKGRTVVIVSCDLGGLTAEITAKARRIVTEKTGISAESVMICCTHTHSGPSTGCSFGWGEKDEPYLELLPFRIARACTEAVFRMEESVLGFSEVPCEGIGLNRVYDVDSPPLEEVLRDDWRPAKPELTDTVCRVITLRSKGRLKGFVSSFGCHPVTCCAETRYIHGDYAGIAMNNLERENPGSVGLFLQGASGDVNSCVVHKPEQESLLALDVIAARFANSVREGIALSGETEIDSLESLSRKVNITRRHISLEELEKKLACYETVLAQEGISEEDRECRYAVLHARCLRLFIEKISAGKIEELDKPFELQLFKIGPVTFFGAPFEVFQGIKNSLQSKSRSRIPILISHANSSEGYAQTSDRAGSGDYADISTPVIKQSLPFADMEKELVHEFLNMEASIIGGGP